MMTDRELMSKALIALDLWEDALTDPCADHVMHYRSFGEDAAKALRERLKEPDEPKITIGHVLWHKETIKGIEEQIVKSVRDKPKEKNA